jgi:trehalose 6-phosphate synthase
VIVVSHRGPVTFRRNDDGSFAARRGAGGVVSALAPLLDGRPDTRWIAAAIGPDDRAAVAAGAVHAAAPHVDLLALDPAAHRLHYDLVSNGTLWFLFHGLFDLPRRPRFDHRWYEAWDGYAAVNHEFAVAIANAAGPAEPVLVQDLHLLLVPGLLRDLRPDLPVVHFTHTPFCGPNSIRVLPEHAAEAICRSLTTGAAGFHVPRWADAFRASAREVLGPDVAPDTAFAATFGPDADALAADAASPAVGAAVDALEARVDDRHLVTRCDRMELSKNIVRGFAAYDLLLEERAEWRGRVVFAALLNPSRESLPEYQAYRAEVELAAARVNERWATSSWEPVHLDTRDDFSRALAGFVRSDVLLVNPIKDGLNLVAMEGPLVGTRDPVLCLSRDAGAFDLLRDAALEVQPYDLVQTAAALEQALTMDPAERRTRAERLRRAATACSPADWLEAQLTRAHR